MSIFERTTTNADPSILLPNRFSEQLKMWFVKCPCGGSPGQRDGFLGNHFPPLHNGAALSDPFYPGTSLCRYSGRAVTLAAATDRDERPTKAEGYVARVVRNSLCGA